MSSIPSTVQRQAQEADALQAQLATTAASDTAAAPAPAIAPPVAAPAPEAASAEKQWEQKYRSLQGILNARTAELTAQNKAYESQLGQLQRQFNELTEALKAQKEEPKKPATPDPRDVEQFGGDLVEMVRKYASQYFEAVSGSLSSVAQRLDHRVSALEQTVNGTSEKVARTQEEQFYVILDQAVPDWRAVNESEAFLDWLAVEDGVYGVTRQAALNHAHSRFDAKRVVAIFNQFKAGRPAAPSLEAQVAPRSASAAPVPATAPAAAEFLSQRFIEQFYRDDARGKYTPQQAAEIEARINAAVREGRVTP